MSLPVRDLVRELTSTTTAHQCLDILAETPRSLGFQIVGFREEIERPIAPRLPDSDAWERRFGWPSGFVASWIAEGHGANFPIGQVMRKRDMACQWTLSDRAAMQITSRQHRAVQYMRRFGIRQGLTIPVRLPFGRTGCVTWFAAEDERPTVDRLTFSNTLWLTCQGNFAPCFGSLSIARVTYPDARFNIGSRSIDSS